MPKELRTIIIDHSNFVLDKFGSLIKTGLRFKL